MDDDATIPIQPVQLSPPKPEALLNLGFRSVAADEPPAGSDEPAALQRHLPQFRVRELIGRGGMGNVMKVDDPKLARTVALKTMKLGPEATEEERGRFVREAAVLAKLAHPNIVPIYDLGTDGAGCPFYTMKLVKGRTLQAILKDLRDGVPGAAGEHSLGRLLNVFRKVCDAMAFAHSSGVIHRDLKPENIMVGEFGEVLVMDWGLAKFLHGEADVWSGGKFSQSIVEKSRASIGASSLGVTMEGAIMGTPQYMSPEQAEGEAGELDERSDIFSLGAILYAILTLHAPVEGRSVEEVLRKISSGEIAPPSAFGVRTEGKATSSHDGAVLDARVFRPLPHCPGGRVPSALSAVTMRALSVDKARRYQSVNEFAAEVEAWQSGFATRAENAGFGRQIVLLVKRHKGSFATAFVAWAIITALAIWFVLNLNHERKIAISEGKRAEGEAARAEKEAGRANRALVDLKASAPSMRDLAESEASFQRFESALAKFDGAIALAPEYLPAYWRRAWLLLGMERFPEAAEAIRLAQQKDPANAKLAAILPVIEQVAAAPAEDRWTQERASAVLAHLQLVGASGEKVALSGKMQLGAEAKLNLVNERLKHWFGSGTIAGSTPTGGIQLHTLPKNLDTLESLRGLPITDLNLHETGVSDLEPLRGMPLRILELPAGKLSDLSPLRGMPLEELLVPRTAVSDLSPLAGMRLRRLDAPSTKVTDLAPLRGMPLQILDLTYTPIEDLSPLKGMPLRILSIHRTKVSDISPLQGMPLEELYGDSCPAWDLSPLRGMPLKILWGQSTDFSPLAGMKLSILRIGSTAGKSTDISTLRGLTVDNLLVWQVTDLKPLIGLHVKVLDISHTTTLRDLSPLLECTELEQLTAGGCSAPIEPLRAHKTLKIISYSANRFPAITLPAVARPVEQFWKEYDAQQAAGKK